MKKFTALLQLGMAMILVIFATSCSTKNSSLTAIPKDASLVVVVDGKTINEKSGVQDITQTKAYQELIKQMSEDELNNLEQFDYILKDSKESGLGFNEEFMMFVKLDNGDPIIGFNLLVTDKVKFDAFVEKIIANENAEAEIVVEENISMLMNNDERVILAWTDEQIIFLAHEDLAEEALANEAKMLLNQGAGESISANSNFSNFYAKKKDVSVWFDYEMVYESIPAGQQMMISSQLPFDMKGTYLYGYMNFEKGKVVVDYETIMNDEMKEFLENYQLFNDDFDKDVLEMMPSPSYANFEMSINLFDYYQMILDMYKEKQMDVDMYTKQVEDEIGITLEDLLKSVSGEMAVSLHNIKMAEKTSMSYAVDENGEFAMKEVTSMSPEFLYSALLKFNDETVWGIFEEKVQEMGLEKTDNYYMIPNADMAVAYVDNVLVISNDLDIIKEILENGKTDPNLGSSEVAKNLGTFPTYMEMNLDIDDYPEDFLTFMKEEGDEAGEILKIMNNYKRIQVIPEDMNHAKIILELKDDSKNSLEVILNSFDETVEVLSQN